MTTTTNPTDSLNNARQAYLKELLALLAREASLASQPEEACRIYLEIGTIYLKELKDPVAAKQTLLRGLEVNRYDTALLQMAQSLANQTKDAELFRQLSGYLEKAKASYEQLLETGRAWRQIYGNLERSVEALLKAHALAPQNPAPLLLLTDNHYELRQWEELAATYRKLLGLLNSENVIGIRFQLFSTLLFKLHKPEEAIETLTPVLAVTEGGKRQQALLLLNRALTQLKRWQELANNLRELAAQTTEVQHRHAYLLDRASLCQLKLADNTSAALDLETVLQEDSNNRGALERLVVIHRGEQEFTQLTRTLERLLALDIQENQPSEVVEHALELARLYEEKLGDGAKAAAILQKAVAVAPTALPLITNLARTYRDQQRWNDLKAIYELELEATEDPNIMLGIYYRLGELLEGPLHDVNGAIVLYQKAAQLSPSYLPINQRLERLYIESDRWQDLIELFETELEAVDQNRRAVGLLHRVASLYDEKLKQSDAAIQAYQRILEIESDDIIAVRALARLYANTANWQKLAETNIREAQLCGDPKQSIALYYNTGVLCSEKLGKPDLAILCFQNALSISPTYLPALQALGQAYAAQENWGGLIGMYYREAQVTANQEKRLHLLTRVAQIYRQYLQDQRSAEKVLRDLLGSQPNYLPAASLLEGLFTEQKRHGELADLYRSLVNNEAITDERLGIYSLKLAQLLHHDLDQAADSEAYYLSALDHGHGIESCLTGLDEIYSQSGRYRELSQLLTSVVGRLHDRGYLFSVLYRLALINLEQLDERENGLNCLLQAYKLKPEDLPVFWDLCRYLEQDHNDRKLAEVYLEQAALPSRQAQRQQLLHQAAGYLDRAGDLKRSVEIAEQALQAASRDPQVLEFLTDLYRKAGESEKLATSLKSFMELSTNPVQRSAICRELALLYQDPLNQPQQAIEVLEKYLLSIGETTDYQAMLSLEHLYQASQNSAKLALLYPRLLRGIKDTESLIQFQLRYGNALEATEQFDQAWEVYRGILEKQPDQPSARGRSKGLLQRLERWPELVAFLTEEVRLSKTPAQPLWEMAELHYRKLQNPKVAVQNCQQALQHDPQHLPSHQTLAAIYFELQDWQGYLQITSNELTLKPESARLLQLHLSRGRILRDQLKQAAQAAQELTRGLKIDPQHREFLAELAKTYEQLQEWPKMLETLDTLRALNPLSESSAAAAKQQGCELLAHMAQIALDGLKDEPRSIAYHEAALNLLPHFEPSLKQLTALFTKNQQWPKLIGIFQRSIEVLKSRNSLRDAIPLYMNLGLIYEQQLNEISKGIQEYSKVLQLDKQHLAAHQGLSRLYSRDKQHYNNAITEFIYLLGRSSQQEKAQPQYFKQIAHIFEELSKFDHLCRAFEAMEFLDLIEPGDREIYHTYASRIPKTFNGVIERGVSQRFLFHPGEHQPLNDFVINVLPDLAVFGSHSLESLGLTKQHRLNPKEEGNLRKTFDQVVGSLDLGTEVELYIKPNLRQHSALIVADPIAVVLDQQWSRSWNKHQLYFFLAAELSQLLFRRGLALQLEAPAFERLVRLTLLPWLREQPRVTPEIQADLDKIKKALSRKTRKWLDENGPKLATSVDQINFKYWLHGIRMTGFRAGLVFCNKLEEAIYAIRTTLNEEMDKKAWESEVVREMILYTLSDEYGTIRKALGTSIYSVSS